MSRFPYVPGAGAKQIGNPVYWSRMTIQDANYKKKRKSNNVNAVTLWNERYKHLWMVYDGVWDYELQKVGPIWTDNEDNSFGKLNDKFISIGDEINENPYLDNGQLNRLKTALKNLVMFVLKKCIEYETFSDLKSVKYCNKSKAIIVDNKDVIVHLW